MNRAAFHSSRARSDVLIGYPDELVAKPARPKDGGAQDPDAQKANARSLNAMYALGAPRERVHWKRAKRGELTKKEREGKRWIEWTKERKKRRMNERKN